MESSQILSNGKITTTFLIVYSDGNENLKTPPKAQASDKLNTYLVL